MASGSRLVAAVSKATAREVSRPLFVRHRHRATICAGMPPNTMKAQSQMLYEASAAPDDIGRIAHMISRCSMIFYWPREHDDRFWHDAVDEMPSAPDYFRRHEMGHLYR